MDREEYNQCMSPHIKGKGKTKEQRQLDFCIGAKLCTGAAGTRAEAEKICQEQPPKAPKVRGKPCSPQSLDTITKCLITHINFNAADMNKELRDNLASCMCGRKEKKLNKAEEAIMALDPDQREALLKLMAERSTVAKRIPSGIFPAGGGIVVREERV